MTPDAKAQNSLKREVLEALDALLGTRRARAFTFNGQDFVVKAYKMRTGEYRIDVLRDEEEAVSDEPLSQRGSEEVSE